MEFLEVSAKSVGEAITKASVELGKTSDELDIQVISEGSSGFLGFGSKPAVIKVRIKEEAKEETPAPAPAPVKEPVKENAPKKQEAKPVKEEKKKQEPKKAPKAEVKEEAPKAEANEEPKKSHEKERKPIAPKTDEEIAAIKKTAEELLTGVFAAMQIPAEIKSSYSNEEGCLTVDFEGEDMGVLIGKHGQTLDSLQYLTSIVVNKDNKEYVRIKLDTEDYRSRRKETLENLARNIGNKVRKTRKTVVLEPMNPYERRIIHSALQSNKAVETYSEGTEPYRHIVVKPVRNNRQ